MEGYRDPFNRRPYPWGHREEGLVSHFRAVGRLRLSQPLYREGEFRLLRLDENAFAFARTDGETALITLLTREGTKLGLPTGAEVLFRLDGGADPAAADGAVIRCTAAEAEAFCAV